MRRTLLLLALLALGVFLLFNPVTGVLAPPADDGDDQGATTLPTTTTTGAPPASTGTTLPVPDTTSTSVAAEMVIAGPRVWSEWGYFQVEITVQDGVMTAVELVSQPSDRKSVRINDAAVPDYVAQALELQSADLDLISGATFTWRYFRESLSGAMEEAGLLPASA